MKESDLCATFRQVAEADGWTVYPEISGWDLVLVWSGDAPIPEGATEVQPGDQVAVEAKLRANVEAIHQAATRTRYHRRGSPDFRAVLAPKASRTFQEVAAMLGVGTFTLRHCGPWTYRGGWERERKIVAAPRQRQKREGPRLWLPPIVPEGHGGEPCPRALTPWRVKALIMMARIREAGAISSADFTELGISPQIWVQQRWIVRAGFDGRRARYVLNENHPGLPDQGWEAERDRLVSTRVDAAP